MADQNQNQANQAAVDKQARQAARQEGYDAAKKEADERSRVNRAMTDEANRRMDEAKPTPSNEEIDDAIIRSGAGLGAAGTSEHEGTPEEDRMITPESVGAESYKTRDMGAKRQAQPTAEQRQQEQERQRREEQRRQESKAQKG